MPCSIQYDPVTGEIIASVTGNFIPEIKDDRKQCIFDEHVDVEGKKIDIEAVVESKVYESSKDVDVVLKVSEEEVKDE